MAQKSVGFSNAATTATAKVWIIKESTILLDLEEETKCQETSSKDNSSLLSKLTVAAGYVQCLPELFWNMNMNINSNMPFLYELMETMTFFLNRGRF